MSAGLSSFGRQRFRASLLRSSLLGISIPAAAAASSHPGHRRRGVRIMAEGPLARVSREQALALGPDYRHACHAMLHAPTAQKLFDNYDMKSAIMMQMRFDGKLGFPGGLVDAGETLEEALNRELREEVGFSPSPAAGAAAGGGGGGGPGPAGAFTAAELLSTHVLEEKKLCLHFYVRALSLREYEELERSGMAADHFGTEVLGVIRCPTYRMGATDGGLPAFLRHSFVGNARQQLLLGIRHAGILSDEQVREVEEISAMSPSRA